MKKLILFIFVVILSIYVVSALEVSVSILDKYKTIKPGEDLQFQVYLKNIEFAGRHDISLDYIISKDNKQIVKSRELKAVETQASFLSRMTVPSNAEPGTYTLSVVINNKESSLSSFTVENSDSTNTLNSLKYYIMILCFVILFVGIMISWELHKVYSVKSGNKR